MPTCPLSKRKALQRAFEMDVEMHAIADIIISGWPSDIKEIPHPLCPYWQAMAQVWDPTPTMSLLATL